MPLAYYQWKSGLDFRQINSGVPIEQICRMYAKLSQKMLSEKSDVPLRQIQLFEQGQRDIAKTQAVTLVRLSQALNCSCEDLLGK